MRTNVDVLSGIGEHLYLIKYRPHIFFTLRTYYVNCDVYFSTHHMYYINYQEIKMAETTKPKSALDRAFETFDKEIADCKVIRKELIDQLRQDAKKMRVSEFDKAMMITAKMSIVTTLNGMLKDVEDSSMKSVKLQLSRTEQENNGQYSQAIVQLLKMVRADRSDSDGESAPVQKEADVQKSLEARGKELGITVTKEELEDGNAALDIPKPSKPEEPAAEQPEETEK